MSNTPITDELGERLDAAMKHMVRRASPAGGTGDLNEVLVDMVNGINQAFGAVVAALSEVERTIGE